MEEGNGKAVEIRNLQDVTKTLSSQMDALAREMRKSFSELNEKIHAAELARVQQNTLYVGRSDCHRLHQEMEDRIKGAEDDIDEMQRQQENWKGSLKVVIALAGTVSVIVTGLFLALAKGLLGI